MKSDGRTTRETKVNLRLKIGNFIDGNDTGFIIFASETFFNATQYESTVHVVKL